MKRMVRTLLCTAALMTGAFCFPAHAESTFDPAYYAAENPDVVAVYGSDEAALLKHYLNMGKAEGRRPSADGQPGDSLNLTEEQKQMAWDPVPLNQLANYSSLKKKMTDAQFEQAYQEALKLVTPVAFSSREEQLMYVMSSLRKMADTEMTYSMSAEHYNDPYGYFILHTASCAGAARATGLCLNILGMPYEHVNENKYSHQWCRVNVNGVYWICDPYGLYCGPEPAPYQHPWL